MEKANFFSFVEQTALTSPTSDRASARVELLTLVLESEQVASSVYTAQDLDCELGGDNWVSA